MKHLVSTFLKNWQSWSFEDGVFTYQAGELCINIGPHVRGDVVDLRIDWSKSLLIVGDHTKDISLIVFPSRTS